jgi:ATP synthase protein I
MTTESSKMPRATSAGTLLGAASVAVGAGLVVAVVTAFVSGGGAATAALVGTGVTFGVIVFGALVVDVVSTVMPTAALIFALLTYALQLLLLLVILVAIDQSNAFSAAAESRALGIAAIAVTLTWTAAQVRLATRRRIPLYDLPVQHTTAGER